MRSLRTIAIAIAGAALLVSQAAAAFAFDQRHPEAASAAPARSATAKYHSLTVAKKAGYSILADTAGITCIAEPGMGAMGVHYVKGDLVKTHPSTQRVRKLWYMHRMPTVGSTWLPWSTWWSNQTGRAANLRHQVGGTRLR